MGPMAIDTDMLNKTINDAAANLIRSADFASGRQRVVIILEGSMVLGLEGYQKLAKERCYYFHTNNSYRAKIRHLKESPKWRKPDGVMDSDYLVKADKNLNYQNWRWFEHQRDWSPAFKAFGSLVKLDPVVGEMQPTLEDRTNDFLPTVEEALNAEGGTVKTGFVASGPIDPRLWPRLKIQDKSQRGYLGFSLRHPRSRGLRLTRQRGHLGRRRLVGLQRPRHCPRRRLQLQLSP